MKDITSVYLHKVKMDSTLLDVLKQRLVVLESHYNENADIFYTPSCHADNCYITTRSSSWDIEISFVDKDYVEFAQIEVYCNDYLIGNITNIQKTDHISGTNAVNIVLDMMRKLEVTHFEIEDQADILTHNGKCLPLRTIRLFEGRQSWYTTFGFKYYPTTQILYDAAHAYVKMTLNDIQADCKSVLSNVDTQIPICELMKELYAKEDLSDYMAVANHLLNTVPIFNEYHNHKMYLYLD